MRAARVTRTDGPQALDVVDLPSRFPRRVPIQLAAAGAPSLRRPAVIAGLGDPGPDVASVRPFRRSPPTAGRLPTGRTRSRTGWGYPSPAPTPATAPPRRASAPPLTTPLRGSRAATWQPPKKRFGARKAETGRPVAASSAVGSPGSA